MKELGFWKSIVISVSTFSTVGKPELSPLSIENYIKDAHQASQVYPALVYLPFHPFHNNVYFNFPMSFFQMSSLQQIRSVTNSTRQLWHGWEKQSTFQQNTTDLHRVTTWPRRSRFNLEYGFPDHESNKYLSVQKPISKTFYSPWPRECMCRMGNPSEKLLVLTLINHLIYRRTNHTMQTLKTIPYQTNGFLF